MSERPNCDPHNHLICPHAQWADKEIARLKSDADILIRANHVYKSEIENLKRMNEVLVPRIKASTVHGCMCPPGAEAGCKGIGCPRHGFTSLAVSVMK